VYKELFINLPDFSVILFYRMKRKQALLRSNLSGITRSDTHLQTAIDFSAAVFLYRCISAYA